MARSLVDSGKDFWPVFEHVIFNFYGPNPVFVSTIQANNPMASYSQPGSFQKIRTGLKKTQGRGSHMEIYRRYFFGCLSTYPRAKKTLARLLKKRGIKYQGSLTPDGLITSMAGPYLGEINDNCIVAVTALQNHLRSVCIFINLFL